MSDMVSITFDTDNIDFEGAPCEVYVQVNDGKRRLYEPTTETTLLNERMSEGTVPIAMCDECGSETYTDDECLYCCMCGARIRRGK